MRRILLLIPLLALPACQEKDTSPRAPIPKEASQDYTLTLGYCYFKEPGNILRAGTFTRGDVKVRGKREGDKLKIEKVLYRLRGDVQGEGSTLTISSPTWGKSTSQPLQKSIFWKEATGLSLPRPAKRGEEGVFNFSFDRTLIDRNCKWSFRF